MGSELDIGSKQECSRLRIGSAIQYVGRLRIEPVIAAGEIEPVRKFRDRIADECPVVIVDDSVSIQIRELDVTGLVSRVYRAMQVRLDFSRVLIDAGHLVAVERTKRVTHCRSVNVSGNVRQIRMQLFYVVSPGGCISIDAVVEGAH